tara:strand:- start:2772 stop:3314 length:543 start_codon:yes stop_codon:yes gene_type:complete
MDVINQIRDSISSFDIIYLIITFLSLIKCTKQGFVLSILVASKWLLAYVITLILFPKIKPYVNNIIDNEYLLDIALGVSIFVLVIFVILLINKGIGKTIKYTGIGSLDKFFGFLFGFVRGYIIAVCIFTTINIVYNLNRWPINLNKSISFDWVEKGSNFLIKEFPSKKEYEDAKEKIENI